jgi:hypothetical protein
MGVYRNGVKMGQPYRNGVKMNAYRNGMKMFSSGPPPPPLEGFGMVVNSGSDSKFILPLKYGSGTAHHQLTIDWGDGNVQVTTGTAGITAQYQGLTHSYPAANMVYTIKITGTTYLITAETSSLFGLGFYSNTTGYNVSTNKAKVKKLLGSPEAIVSANMASRNSCYYNMFANCTGLTEIPANLLPATTLENYCYSNMFYGCSGLTTLPDTLLPATTLENYCYSYMFSGCTKLTTLPANLLPATTLASSCYYYMFYGCSGLIFIYMTPDWFTGKTAQASMFRNCTNITANTAYANIPSEWK